MVKKTLALLLIASAAWAASTNYYWDYPETTALESNDRILVYKGYSMAGRDRNITLNALADSVLKAGRNAKFNNLTAVNINATGNVQGSSNLNLKSNPAGNGYIKLGATSVYDEPQSRLGIGTTSPRSVFDLSSSAVGKKPTATIGSATNYVSISQDLGYRAKGTTTTWDDLRVEPVVKGVAGGTTPSYDATGFDALLFLYTLPDVGGKYLYFTAQMPHAWKEGSSVYPHIHFIPVGTNTGQVDFIIKCAWASPFSSTVYTTGVDYTASYNIAANSQYKHLIASNVTGITMTDKTLSSVGICRLDRSASDSNASAVQILYIDIHHEVDGLGSDTEYSKTATP